ncbi:MobH family relaxase [Cellvibrio sp. UBA7671]|uniref:MobH family relaxase n=1 Tax=Cellvibrio sp. UBA7671 TaxID=1946312 RepID=UPI002F35B7E7
MSQLLPICTAEQLFAQCKLDPTLAELRTLAGLDAPVFDLLIKTPIYQFAELVQLAPASEAHHHAGPGGLLKHTLDVITLALKKRRGYQLPIAGSLSEISTQRHLWTYAIFVGCLLHDIGKLSANTRLILIAKDGSEKSWTPHSGTMTHLKNLKGYRIEFRKTPYHYHAHLALTHWDLIPKEARTWLIEASNIMAELTAWLWGDKFESGTIGDIVEAADRESTAKDLQLPNEPRFSNAIPVIERYLKIIRHWIQEGGIKINTNGGMGWVDGSGHLYLVCRSLAEKLIQECNSQGLKHLPQDPVRVYDILQEHGYALPTDDGKAIWPIRVKTSGYEHKFTCLKFEARKLTLPSRPLRALEGEISIVTTDIQETVTTLQEAESIETTAFELEPAKEDLNNTQREISNAANAKESDEEMPSDEDILTAEISDYIPDAIQESAPMRDTVEDNSATAITSHDSEKSPLQETEAAVADQETGAVAESAIGLIRNLDFEAPDTGQKFLSWLQRGLIEKTIIINNITAEVHIVDEGVFLLAPAIFKTFLRLHGVPEEKHKNLSKRFQNLRKHIRNGDVNIHPYWVSSTNRKTKINGWLLPFNVIYENDYPVPKPNKYIKKELGSGGE